jgi:hypothetical protein
MWAPLFITDSGAALFSPPFFLLTILYNLQPFP